jgi:sodium/bile acid cotransporter 7
MVAAISGSGGGSFQTYAVAALFFIAGVGLPSSVLRDAVSDVRLNTFIHGFVFVFPTAIVAACAPFMVSKGWLDVETVNGLFVMAALPTTVGSGVAFTQAAGGNFSAALLNSLSTNLLGIVVTPFLIHMYLGADSTVDPFASSSKLFVEAFLPVVLGMSLRTLPGVAEASSGAWKGPSKFISDTILLGIIAKTFAAAEQSEAGALNVTSGVHLLTTLAAFMAIHKGTIWLLARSVQAFTKPDRIAALYMGSHKTLAFGLPLIVATFENDPNVTAYILPLVVYHPLQIFVSSLLVPPLKKYANAS